MRLPPNDPSGLMAAMDPRDKREDDSIVWASPRTYRENVVALWEVETIML